MSDGRVAAWERRKERDRAESKIREAEKDITFALLALHEGKVAKALLNLAVATVRLSGVMTEQDFDSIFSELDRLKATVG